jgi:hypothetical protein
MLLKLNLLSLIPIINTWSSLGAACLSRRWRAPVIAALPDQLPGLVGLLLILPVLPLHELCHGLMIRHYGHTPRYGAKWLVMFATSDGALFRRAEFVRIALAPLVMITLAGALLMLFIPQGLASWVAWAITLNAAGSIGDLWMTAVALRFGSSALIRDEADGMRIFTPYFAPSKSY